MGSTVSDFAHPDINQAQITGVLGRFNLASTLMINGGEICSGILVSTGPQSRLAVIYRSELHVPYLESQ